MGDSTVGSGPPLLVAVALPLVVVVASLLLPCAPAMLSPGVLLELGAAVVGFIDVLGALLELGVAGGGYSV